MRRFVGLFFVMLAVCCSRSLPTEPGGAGLTETPTPVPPTPTPVPMAQVAGAWSGTLDGFCRFDPWKQAVTAQLEQHGTVVTGRFSNSTPGLCTLTGDFSGRVSGNTLSGSIGSISLSGSATESEMVLDVSNGYLLFGKLTLRR